MSETVLLFSLEGQRLAIPASRVGRVLPMAIGRPLPGSPPLVEAVLDWHGTPLPVLDLRRCFRLPARPPGPSDHLLIVSLRGRSVALRVDRALDIMALPRDALRPASGLAPVVPDMAGIARIGDDLIFIYDPDTFLSEAEAQAVAELVEAPHG